jgi:hypothetical protein
MRMVGAIHRLKYRVMLDGRAMTLFDARDLGLVDIHFDKDWGSYSFQVIKTGEIVSFEKYLNSNDWSPWYREAIAKRDQQTNTTGTAE